MFLKNSGNPHADADYIPNTTSGDSAQKQTDTLMHIAAVQNNRRTAARHSPSNFISFQLF